jgi:hypothetical protein
MEVKRLLRNHVSKYIKIYSYPHIKHGGPYTRILIFLRILVAEI